MTEKSEGRIQKEIVDYFSTAGFIVLRLNSGSLRVGSRTVHLCPPGTPDLLLIGNRVRLFIEVKKPGKKVSRVQREMIKKLKDFGNVVFIADSLESIFEQMKSIKA